MTPPSLRELLDASIPEDGVPFTVDSEQIMRAGRRVRRRRRVAGLSAGVAAVLVVALAVPLAREALTAPPTRPGAADSSSGPVDGGEPPVVDDEISWDDSSDWDSVGIDTDWDESLELADQAIYDALYAVDPALEVVPSFDGFEHFLETARDDSAERPVLRQEGWITRDDEPRATWVEFSVFDASVVDDLKSAVDCDQWTTCDSTPMQDGTELILTTLEEPGQGWMNRVYSQRPDGNIMVFTAQVDLITSLGSGTVEPQAATPSANERPPLLSLEDLVSLMLAMPQGLTP